MHRLAPNLLFVVALCVGSVAVRAEEDPWFPDPFKPESPPPPADGTPPPLYPDPNSPAPYYDSPPYASGDPPLPVDPPEYCPWFSSGFWEQKTESWPAPWKAETSVADAFGPDAVKVYGQISLLDGILSKDKDGYSDLLKEGITALLNAIDKHFKYTEDEIKAVFSFKIALSSEETAALQAKLFKFANDELSSP